uniref:NADH-ubiquinone oxidoreductase chain 2 n=1 Tax=Pristurus somalicus TaxID=706260 RepID=D3XB33_9SAUR|nr:NADH dehydrogenase subunit 2 [Pristurus somalicus]
MHPTLYGLFLITLFTSTLITMSSTHWLLAWMGLELNTLAMLPLIAHPYHPRATEATTKYFLAQTAASALLLFSAASIAWNTGQWAISCPAPTLSTTTLTTAITMKLGLAPLHFWYPEVLQGATMTTALIISTWQKFAPLALMYMTYHIMSPHLMLALGICSITVGGCAGLIHTQLRKIMAYSSIGHMGWLFVALTLDPALASLTLLTYTATTTTVFIAFSHANMKTVTDISTAWLHTPAYAMLTALTLLSLGGLPPLTGFLPKWLIIKDLLLDHLAPVAIALALLSLPALYFYVRLTYFTTLTTTPTTHTKTLLWRLNHTPPHATFTTTLATLALPLTTALYQTM